MITHSEAETVALGRELAARLQPGDIVLLFGELGAGKTAFVRGLAQGLGIDPDDVSSPTFTIVQEYGGGRAPLLHVDLYRLESREVDDLGLEELGAEAVTAVEWAERLPRVPGRAVHVTLKHAGESTRDVTIRGTNTP
ncbi:MAG TPA: tRNA (adenosine(37)-N6)-threonylcarbamoyltransferase complex ATPase subunit type 1 TsaE [Vicinamibacterales bacterium]|nr:tRNA (adenosine(37)-N6)-threonylcarbamoyltransferase complex ATPase subunit type 1 TsaE [Vicinamibacterales bacterium]